MKTLRKILFIVFMVLIVMSLVACNGGGNNNQNKNNQGNNGNNNSASTLNGRTISGLTPTANIRALSDLVDYSRSESHYGKTAVSFSGTQYAGQDCSEQLEKLTTRIESKKQDVKNEKNTSSFVKIFALSTADGLLERMAIAALTFDEMNRVVDYLYGSEENVDVTVYLRKEDNLWKGTFTDGTTTWLSLRSGGKDFNEGWSFFDDMELYDRMKDYTEDQNAGTNKDLAGDNAAWQYRSILKKVYTEVQLPGDAASRLATYMLDYAIELVESKSGGSASDAITTSGGNTTFGPFAVYCKTKSTAAGDHLDGLGDYDTLSYLLAFNAYYTATNGLKSCVLLYGYYYDYNKTYYFESLADETTYAKQLKYEKQNTFTDTEWLDYVSIQRNNYVKAYRYTPTFYEKFYDVHFNFQNKIEDYESKVYEMQKVRDGNLIEEIKVTDPNTTYTSEMKKATSSTPGESINGIVGQLALSDWMWCYSAHEQTMKDYNQANTQRYNGSESGNSEQKYEGKFNFEMQQLYCINYLFTKMSDIELSSALYYQVYAYSASMVRQMQTDLKQIVYVHDEMESGSYYTHIATGVNVADSDKYACEKIAVLYNQAYLSWFSADVPTKAAIAKNQGWRTMNTEIESAIAYDYANMVTRRNHEWEDKCERMEDLVIVRKWSCCGQKVHEATTEKCEYDHVRNKDGSTATKDYDTNHTISLFMSNYEAVMYHIAGQITMSFCAPDATKDFYKTTEAVSNSKIWEPGYKTDGSTNTIAELRKKEVSESQMSWNTSKPARKIVVSSGNAFVDAIADADDEDEGWWNNNKTLKADNEGIVSLKDKSPILVEEQQYSSVVQYEYHYTFVKWYLDQDNRFEFDERDTVNIDLKLYAGYKVEKRKK